MNTQTTKTAAPSRGRFGELLAERHVHSSASGRGFCTYSDPHTPVPVKNPRKNCPVMFYQRLMWRCIRDLNRIPDSHGWDGIGTCVFDRKMRGQALNVDLYGYGRDIHCGRDLVVIQVRQYEKTSANGWPNIRKNYYLCGYNEDGSVFAHPVESAVIHSAIRRGADVVQAVQTWMFGHDYARVIRQGDVGLIPVRRIPAGETVGQSLTVADHHSIRAAAITRAGGRVYAVDPTLTHPGHDTVTATGSYEVVVARRAETWKFTTPHAD